MAIREFLTNFHLGAVSGWDLFILLIFLIAVLVYGFFLGRNRLIVLLLSSYFSWIICQSIPWIKLSTFGWLKIEDGPSASLEIIIFLGLIILFYFFIPRSVLSSSLRIKKRGEANWWQLFLLSVVQVGLLIMAILSFLDYQDASNLGSIIKKIFVGPEAKFVWLILPIFAVVLMRRKKIDK